MNPHSLIQKSLGIYCKPLRTCDLQNSQSTKGVFLLKNYDKLKTGVYYATLEDAYQLFMSNLMKNQVNRL